MSGLFFSVVHQCLFGVLCSAGAVDDVDDDDDDDDDDDMMQWSKEDFRRTFESEWIAKWDTIYSLEREKKN